MTEQKICLTIAGVDPSGGAGTIADIKTFAAFGCFGTAAIASLTFQNTQGVFGAVHQTAETVRRQIEPVLDDFEVSAIKTGMLPTQEIIEEIADIFTKRKHKNFIVDPVVRSTSGFDLIDDNALLSLIEKLFPLSDLITPNLPEAERISQIKIENDNDIEKAAEIMQNLGAKNVLIKGGHISISDLRFGMSDSKDRKARDFLFLGEKKYIFEDEFYDTKATHGTGCTLASAIAANLALGKDFIESVEISKKYVNKAIKFAPNIGKGNSPINHFVKI